jgi:hypothetical protein
MPTERLSMRRIREVLRLKYAQGLSERAIAASFGLGKGTVRAYLGRARTAGLTWPLPGALTDDHLELLLFPAAPSVPDPIRKCLRAGIIESRFETSAHTSKLAPYSEKLSGRAPRRVTP